MTDGPLRRTQRSWIKKPQRPEVIRRIKQRIGRHGRMHIWEDVVSTKEAMPVLVSLLLTMWPHTDSSPSLSSLLSKATQTSAS